MNPAYDMLKTRFARIATLGEASAMLGWDASAMMPAGGGAARGEQLATLAGLMHDMLIAPETGAALSAAEADGDWGSANLALMRRAHIRATALPTALVEEATTAQQAYSGVNLDEEAANLMRFQQAYQASGKVLQIASQLFQQMLDIN